MKMIKNRSPLQVLSRFIAAWSVTLFITFFTSGKSFYSKEFAFDVNTPLFLTSGVILFFLFLFVKSDKLISVLTVIFSTLYAVLVCSRDNGDGFFIGACLVCSAVVLYSKIEFNFKLSRKALSITAAVLAVIFTLYVGTQCYLRYLNYSTPCYDFGIFSQMFYHMKECGLPFATCERDTRLSHFAVHFSPIFYLLLPVYMIAPDPGTLMFAQCAIIASGIFPLLKICKRHKLSNTASLIFVVLYFFYPCFIKSCFFYIHENNFLLPLILYLLYFMESEKSAKALFITILILFVKEDAAVYTSIIAVYFIFINKNYKCNLSILALSILYFAVVLFFLDEYGDGVMTYRYANYMTSSRNSLFAVVETALKNPAYVISQCMREKKIIFIFQMLLPVAFLPFITKKPVRLILVSALLLVNLMTNYIYQYDIGYQYCFASGAMLIYLSVIHYAELKIKKQKVLITALVCSVIIFSCTSLPYMGYYANYREARETREAIRQATELVPENASVAASTFLLPNLSQRDEIYQLETTKNKAQYYVLDLRSDHREYSLSDFQNEKYQEIYLKNDVVAVYKYIQ